MQYCTNPLHNIQRDVNLLCDFETDYELLSLKMKNMGNEDNEAEISLIEFIEVIESFKKKCKLIYNLITKAWIGFQQLVFKISKRIRNSEEFPSGLNLSTLLQVLKRGQLMHSAHIATFT